MKTRVEFVNAVTGIRQVVDVTAVVYVRKCKGCGVDFRTENASREYHAERCREGAKYIRKAARP